MLKNDFEQHSSSQRIWGIFGALAILLVSLGLFYLAERAMAPVESGVYLPEQLEVDKSRLRSEMSYIQAYLVLMDRHAETQLKNNLKDHVQNAIGQMQYLYDQHKDDLSESQLKSLIIEAMRAYRFAEGRGYIFIDDQAGNAVLLPTHPEREGTSLMDNRDDQGVPIMQRILDAVNSKEQAGFVNYRWYQPFKGREMFDKVSYVQRFAPFDWVVGTGDYLNSARAHMQAMALEQIASVNIGQFGYVTVFDQAGHVLWSPLRPVGSSPLHYSQFKNQTNRTLARDILTLAKNGGGFTEYVWPLPGNDGQAVNKLSLVEPTDVWDWVLVAGLYPGFDTVTPDIKEQQQRELAAEKAHQRGVVIGLGIGLLLLVLIYARWINRVIADYRHRITHQSDMLSQHQDDLSIATQVFETSREGIMLTDHNNKIVSVNEAFSKITGYTREEVIGRNPNFLSSGKHSPEFYRGLWGTLAVIGQWQGEIWNKTKLGEVYLQRMSISVFRNKEGQITHYIATFSDRSEHIKVEERLRYVSRFDELTGLPNRKYLKGLIDRFIQQAHNADHMRFALLFVDLDRFKNINDSLGHGVGDTMLKEIARRLSSAVREGDSIARIGGDEFAIKLILPEGCNAVAVAASLSDRLLKLVSDPFKQGDIDLYVTPSIGITLFPTDGNSTEELFRNADTALYDAKERGRNNYQFYSDDMNERVAHRLRMEHSLRQALDHGEFFLEYQPQYRLADEGLAGAEVLIRWRHKEERIPPDHFIPLAEELGLIRPIGAWVLQEACQQAAIWLSEGLEVPELAVNVSAMQFNEALLPLVEAVLDDTGFPAERLVLEITESALMMDAVNVENLIMALRERSIRVALDDFGTGYSSLAYLKRFPIDKLKIDRAFVDGLPDDSDDRALTHSILDVSRHLNLETVAEGVETSEQGRFLKELGCQYVQGYFYSRPLSMHEFEKLLISNKFD
jgi:diguanylate cyclase (GGDEF)-like protein/PAS domain S-box-containing protein